MDWLKRNKTLVGLIVAVFGAYTSIKCPGISHDQCKYLSDILISLGSFLTGAGILPSDYREKVVQGIVDPTKEKE